MKMTFAGVLLWVWMVMVPTAFLFAIFTCARKGRNGIIPGLELLLGTLLLFGFVSGVIGCYEMNDYVTTLSFRSSIAFGFLGLGLIGLGLKGAFKPATRQARSDSL